MLESRRWLIISNCDPGIPHIDPGFEDSVDPGFKEFDGGFQDFDLGLEDSLITDLKTLILDIGRP